MAIHESSKKIYVNRGPPLAEVNEDYILIELRWKYLVNT